MNLYHSMMNIRYNYHIKCIWFKIKTLNAYTANMPNVLLLAFKIIQKRCNYWFYLTLFSFIIFYKNIYKRLYYTTVELHWNLHIFWKLVMAKILCWYFLLTHMMMKVYINKCIFPFLIKWIKILSKPIHVWKI